MKEIKEIEKLLGMPFDIELLNPSNQGLYLFVTERPSNFNIEVWAENCRKVQKYLAEYNIRCMFIDKASFGNISIYKLEENVYYEDISKM